MSNLQSVIFKNSHRQDIKKSKKEKFLYFLSFLIVFGFLLTVMTIVSVYVTKQLNQFNQGYAFTNILLLMNFFILFTKSVFESLNVLYFSKDLKILLRMPINNKEIVKSKMINMIISEYQMEAIMLAIPIVVYGIMTKVSLIFYLYSLVILIILPVIPITLVSLLISIIMRFTNKLKDKSKVMYITIFIAFIVLSILFSYASGNSNVDYSATGFTQIVLKTNGLAESISDSFVLIKPIMNALLNYESKEGFVNLMAYLIESIICYYVVLEIISIIYSKGVIGTQINTNKGNRKLINKSDFKKHSMIFSYLIKEFKTLTRSPIFCLQCVIMPIVDPIIVFSIVYFLMNFAESVGINMWIRLAGLTYLSYNYAMFLGIGQVLYMMNFSSIIAVSRDAYNAKLMKSIPISLEKQFNIKLSFGVILNMISLIGVSKFYFDCSHDLMLTILLAVSLLFINLIGEKYKLLIDLSKPQMKWDSEYTMMKQNTNVMYELFYTILFIIVVILIGAIIPDIKVFAFIITIILIITNFILTKKINKNIYNVFGKIL